MIKKFINNVNVVKSWQFKLMNLKTHEYYEYAWREFIFIFLVSFIKFLRSFVDS